MDTRDCVDVKDVHPHSSLEFGNRTGIVEGAWWEGSGRLTWLNPGEEYAGSV